MAITTTVTRLTEADITERKVAGTGLFDGLMVAMQGHLQVEYDKNRITGAEYTKAYIAMVQTAMAGAIQFSLGREQAFWQSEQTREQAELLIAQREQLDYQTANILPAQKIGLDKDNVSKDYTNIHLLPAQLTSLNEQTEGHRAKTLDTRTDGVAVTGAIGKQKDLHQEQITSYKRDAETKVAKMLGDIWTVQKTVDEGLLPPSSFTDTNIDAVMGKLRTNLGL